MVFCRCCGPFLNPAPAASASDVGVCTTAPTGVTHRRQRPPESWRTPADQMP
jgi:hypothetical protein